MSTDPASRATGFLSRIDAVQARLVAHARRPAVSGLTEPDAPSGERWEWGQVWAHLAEFVPYWVDQLRMILEQPQAIDPVPFGRTKADPGRIEAIERDRGRPARELFARLVRQLDDLREFTSHLEDEDWARRARHPTLGEMTVPGMFEEFLVGHLEAHADQLDGLVAEKGPGIRVGGAGPPGDA